MFFIYDIRFRFPFIDLLPLISLVAINGYFHLRFTQFYFYVVYYKSIICLSHFLNYWLFSHMSTLRFLIKLAISSNNLILNFMNILIILLAHKSLVIFSLNSNINPDMKIGNPHVRIERIELKVEVKITIWTGPTTCQISRD